MINRIIFAGSGGQGIMTMGKLLAQAAMREGKFVTYLPAYGAEVRGGTANCMVIVSDEQIGSPYVAQADSVVVMNDPSREKFTPTLAGKGLLVVNSSLAKPDSVGAIMVVSHPFTDIGISLGNARCANMVALGCFVARSKLVSLAMIEQIITESTPAAKKDIARMNCQALRAGFELK
jgi:2-oxoglutarate ferredoxin oxidoreductase subunit gamma